MYIMYSLVMGNAHKYQILGLLWLFNFIYDFVYCHMNLCKHINIIFVWLMPETLYLSIDSQPDKCFKSYIYMLRSLRFFIVFWTH